MSLGHADREVAQTFARELADLGFGLGVEVDVAGTVDVLGDRLDLVLNRLAVLIEMMEGVGLFAGLYHSLGEVGGRWRSRPRSHSGSPSCRCGDHRRHPSGA